MEILKCQDCEKDAVMFEGLFANMGYCYEHAAEYATEEWEKEEEEERTGISELTIIQRAMDKKISLRKAKEELLKEKQDVTK